jgi:translation initiation factor 3 subunit F
MSAPALHLRGSTKYKLHPVVVFSILDFYKRRSEGQDRVIGTLLGERKGNEVHITNCFRVPHAEQADEVATVDVEYHVNMCSLHSRVNPKEVVVGWFTTGGSITYLSSQIHAVYEQQTESPVLLLVDTTLTNHRLAVKAYQGKTLKVAEKPVVARFERTCLEYSAHEAEKIGVDALITGQPDGKQLDAPATILSDFDSLELSVSKLLDMLEAVSAYVTKVVEGKIPGDPEIGRAIGAALAAVPNIDSSNFDKMFTSNIQDLLMIVYLSNLTRAQLALADKISGLLL